MTDKSLHKARFAGAISSNDAWQRGQVVISKAGRDRGRYYLVIGAEQEFLLCADGRRRPPELPKRKNVRHLQRTNEVAADLVVKAKDRAFTATEIREAIARARQPRS